MASAERVAFDLEGELTLLDLVLVVQEFTRNDDETVATVTALLDSGRVRVRRPAGRSSLDTLASRERGPLGLTLRLARTDPPAEMGRDGRDEPPWPDPPRRRMRGAR